MGWYVAHAIMFVQFKDGIQDSYPVWENIYLVQADSHVSAALIGSQIAKETEGDSNGSFTWNDRPATWVFAGIRKTVECAREADPLVSGIELTYNEFTLRDKHSLDLLVKSKPVEMVLDESFRE